MTLKDILDQHKNEEVLEVLYDMYPEARETEEGYVQVMDYVRAVVPYSFDEFVIRIGIVDPSDDDAYEEGIDEDAYLTVSGYSKKEDLEFALGFTKWDEWAIAEFVIEPTLDIEPLEIVALCIYEMTFYGFDQESIQKELNDLEQGLANAMYH